MRAPRVGSMGEDSVEWPRDALEIERIDEQAGVADLATSAAAHEPPKLLLGGTAAPLRHLLQRPESMEITVGAEDFFDGRHAKRTNQLILQVRDAHVEPELLHFRTSEVGAQTGALECPAKHRLLAGVAETSDAHAVVRRSELVEEASDAVRAPEPNEPDSRRCEVNPAPLGQRLDRDLVAHAFDDHDRATVGLIGCHIHRRHLCTIKRSDAAGLHRWAYWARTSDPRLVELSELRVTSRELAAPTQSGYSSFRQARVSAGWAFGVRSSRKLKYGATNGSGAITV
jgi:hypothetical protein